MMDPAVQPVATPGPQAPRVGVYICHCGGNISDVVDVARLAEWASGLPGVVVARTNMFMCSDPGQAMIREDVAKERLDRVVVAACSPRLHETTFRSAVARAGLNPYLYEHANIREQVSWVTRGDPQGATSKAADLVAAAVAKALRLKSLDPIRVEAHRHALVIGGGVSGLKAALDLSRSGIDVTLVERTPFLGGHMAQLDRVFPTSDDARRLLAELINAAVGDARIRVLVNAELVAAKGYVGNFDVTIRQHPRGVTGELRRVDEVISACPVQATDDFQCGLSNRRAIYLPYDGCYPALPTIDWNACTRCGACREAAGEAGIDLEQEAATLDLRAGVIVVATGFDHYQPRQGEYGFAELPEVITLPQLIRLMASDGPTAGRLEWNGRPVRDLAVIHCVGSRQIEGLHEPQEDGKVNEYCSRVCCTAALQSAIEVRDRFPKTNVFDFYQDIRTYGRGHEDYYENASQKRVLFFRYAPEEPPLVEAAPSGSDHPVVVRVKDRLTWGEEIVVPVDLVVLAVGMMPKKVNELVDALKLPVGSDRYLLEVHPKLRPVEVATNGVLLAGTSQSPRDITESTSAASAAAAKATAVLSRGYVELDPFIAVVDPAKCTGCGDCLMACGYKGTIMLEGSGATDRAAQVAVINPALCKGCGACVSVCPTRAIDLNGWSLEQFEAMVDAIAAEETLLGSRE
ncbi:MAG: CoB--CoM heterodisulfide reductase iron-sulfur subunit A family protein [Chloroflexota bacterium]